MNKIFNHIKDIISNQDKKRVIENCIIIIIIGIIIIVAGGTLFQKKDTSIDQEYLRENRKSDGNAEDGSAGEGISVLRDGENYSMEEKLESILSQIAGAGKVSVMITYVSGSEKVPAYDTRRSENDTHEEDNSGGSRIITQRDIEEKIAYEEVQSGTKKPIILKEKSPEVKGVVVVADGANEPVVKENLVRAVQTLMDVPPHKVQVFMRKK
ncbi:MAG: stage III sporulation protein AG [Firmicutes bacterium]|nr:stage III sporulation protein AG [Bacillota bacterium]